MRGRLAKRAFVVERKTTQVQEAEMHGNRRYVVGAAVRCLQGVSYTIQTAHPQIGKWRHINVGAKRILQRSFRYAKCAAHIDNGGNRTRCKLRRDKVAAWLHT